MDFWIDGLKPVQAETKRPPEAYTEVSEAVEAVLSARRRHMGYEQPPLNSTAAAQAILAAPDEFF